MSRIILDCSSALTTLRQDFSVKPRACRYSLSRGPAPGDRMTGGPYAHWTKWTKY